MDLTGLRAMDRDALERLYIDTPLGPPPSGTYKGTLLAWMDNPGVRDPLYHTLEYVGFVLLPWGIDFATRRWYFVAPPIQMGHFELAPGPSRWRPTETYGIDYGVSRLPRCIRSRLYDEVKTLGDGLCLGIGGVNLPVGQGDHFFFALTRTAA